MASLLPHPFNSNPLKTREDLASALVSLLDPLAQFTSPGGARISLGHTATHYDEIAASLEGFSRPLWGLASLLAGGSSYDGTKRWIDGFTNGTDPAQETEYWGATRGKDQRMVEMAAMGFTLAVAREHFWDKLTSKAQDDLTTWLSGINGKDMPNTNWLWFRVFANLGLRSVGASYSPEQLKADLDHLDTFYLGDGWSRDGPSGVRQLDYYSSSFAIQFAQLVYSKLANDDDPVRCEEYRDRARKFALDFVHYFDEEGRAIPFGRSLTYRFATSSFWGALAYADVLPPAPLDSWGTIKGLLLRNIRYHSRLPILSPSGTLTIGYAYPNMFFTENYNSPGSPYWAFKAFLPLAVSPDHPFWTTDERPYPLPTIPATIALRHPSHIVSHLGGHTFLLSSGQACHYPLRCGAEKYGKLAYSAAFGYSVPTGTIGLDMWNPDSTIALSEDGGERWVVRRHVEANDPSKEDGAFLESSADLGDEAHVKWLRAVWKPWPDTSVETWLFPPQADSPLWHVRVHRIRTTRAQLKSSDAGFAIYGQGADDRILPVLGNDIQALSGTYGKVEGNIPEYGAPFAAARSAAGVAGILDLTPILFSSGLARSPLALQLDSNANIISARTCMPTLMADIPASGTESIETWFATGVFAIPSKASAGGAHKLEAQTEGLNIGVDLVNEWARFPRKWSEAAKAALGHKIQAI